VKTENRQSGAFSPYSEIKFVCQVLLVFPFRILFYCIFRLFMNTVTQDSDREIRSLSFPDGQSRWPGDLRRRFETA
jgi:hypothetical protein